MKPNVVCMNANCTEHEAVKVGTGDDMTSINVYCGVCWQLCEATDADITAPNGRS